MRRNSLSTGREEGYARWREPGDTGVPREEVVVGAAENTLAGAGSRSILFAQGAQSCTVLIPFQAALRM